jgi:hypothetical protein
VISICGAEHGGNRFLQNVGEQLHNMWHHSVVYLTMWLSGRLSLSELALRCGMYVDFNETEYIPYVALPLFMCNTWLAYHQQIGHV